MRLDKRSEHSPCNRLKMDKVGLGRLGRVDAWGRIVAIMITIHNLNGMGNRSNQSVKQAKRTVHIVRQLQQIGKCRKESR